MNTRLLILFLITSEVIGLSFCKTGNKKSESSGEYILSERRFFSETSFWNRPIPEDPEIDPQSEYWIGLLKTEPTGNNFGINATRYTIPVYEADSTTPRYDIGLVYLSENQKKAWRIDKDCFGHGPGFGKDVPIPDNATPDTGTDMHFAVVDRGNMIAWDMWGMEKTENGQWISKTGMKYSLDGEGVFSTGDFDIKNGESIHFYGPGRASGVPAIAGLIMYDEVVTGRISHKLACATRFNALQEFVFPAAWTDGTIPGGIPEGAVIQLDPELDIEQFDLLRGEKVIARALQEYGMVVVDNAGGSPIYAEGLWDQPGKSWEGVLREWEGGINSIPLDHYRILKIGKTVKMGDARWRD